MSDTTTDTTTPCVLCRKAGDPSRYQVSDTTTDIAPRWLLPIPEACKGLGVGRSTFYEIVGRGDIEVVRIGRRALVPVAAIEEYVKGLRPSHGVPAA